MLTRSLTGVLMTGLFLCAAVAVGEGKFFITKEGAKVWEAPSGGWRVGGIGAWPVDKIVWVMERKPAEVTELKLCEVIAAEPGEWLSFGIRFKTVQRVVFTKDTKIILVDKEGKRYESEGCLFTPDMMQTQVYDSRKMAVVVTKDSVYRRPKDGTSCLTVKFAVGSFRLKDIVEFEVVGAVEDTVQRGGQ